MSASGEDGAQETIGMKLQYCRKEAGLLLENTTEQFTGSELFCRLYCEPGGEK